MIVWISLDIIWFAILTIKHHITSYNIGSDTFRSCAAIMSTASICQVFRSAILDGMRAVRSHAQETNCTAGGCSTQGMIQISNTFSVGSTVGSTSRNSWGWYNWACRRLQLSWWFLMCTGLDRPVQGIKAWHCAEAGVGEQPDELFLPSTRLPWGRRVMLLASCEQHLSSVVLWSSAKPWSLFDLSIFI